MDVKVKSSQSSGSMAGRRAAVGRSDIKNDF